MFAMPLSDIIYLDLNLSGFGRHGLYECFVPSVSGNNEDYADLFYIDDCGNGLDGVSRLS